MKLRKYTTENENGTDVDVYAVCEDDGSVICLEQQADFSRIIERAGFGEALEQLVAPRTKTELVTEAGLCGSKYILIVRTPHAPNMAADEVPL